MSRIILNITTLTLIVIVVVQQTNAQTDPQPEVAAKLKPPGLLTRTKRRPTIAPTCRRAPRCGRRTPAACARNLNGMCRRFNNICHLFAVNCPQGLPVQGWSYVPLLQCSRLRRNATGQCFFNCPRAPLSCRTGGRKICVRSFNRQQCRLLENPCILRNLHCHTSPRGNWIHTEMDRCKYMSIGAQPQKCRGGKIGREF